MVDPIAARQSELEQHILILQLGLGVLIVVLFTLIARQNCRKRPAEPELMSPLAQPTPTELVSSPPPTMPQSIDHVPSRPLQQTSMTVQSREVLHSINAPLSQSEISDSNVPTSSTSHNESLHSPTAEDFRALRQALLSSMLEHRQRNKRRTDPERNPNDTEWLKSPPSVDNGTRMAHEFDLRHENDMLHSPSAPVPPAEPVSSATKPSPMTRSASFFPSLSKLVSARRGQHSKAPSSAESAASATSTASIKSSHNSSPIFSPVNISAAVATLQLSPERVSNDRSVDRNSIDTFLSPLDPANH
jgi:Na+-transporting methylmalonyl-CoA/oxaloacetate decarboxylase gamma subunit